MLGKTLMIVREQIRQELENPSKPLVQSTPKESETTVKENESITKENSDSNESGESDEEDEIEPNTNNERYVGGLRIISTPSSMDPKKAMAKKRKARRKRNVFVDNSGTSHVERNNEHKGQVNLVGGDKSILFSEKALPPSAKLVLHKHQYQRRFEPDVSFFLPQKYIQLKIFIRKQNLIVKKMKNQLEHVVLKLKIHCLWVIIFLPKNNNKKRQMKCQKSI